MHLDPSVFHVSTTTGFLLDSPLELLPDYFQPWQETAKSMVQSISDHDFRDRVNRLPLLDVDRLVGHRQIRLAHLQLSTLVSGYIWCNGDDQVPRILPKNLAVPFFKVNEKLSLAPGIGSHVAVVLCNYKLKYATSLLNCDNMEMLYFKFIEDYGNDWFSLNTAQVELDFAAAVSPLRNAIMYASTHDIPLLIESLREISHVIGKMENSLNRMDERLKPDVFFHQFRPFLAGTSGGKFEKWGGIILEGVSDRPFTLPGGSAAQAAPIQCLDALLQIKHETSSKEFLLEMRNYMLPDHRRFIEHIERSSRVRDVVAEYESEHPDLKMAYDECVKALLDFRNSHIRIVSRYIIAPKARQSDALRTYRTLDEIGTGGTGIMPFLKNIRDTTKQRLI